MESHNQRSIMALSVAQIVISVMFLILGIVDGFQIRFGYVSLLYTPCWVAALTLTIGAMGLVLANSRKPSSNLITAIWSVSVACILYSAMTVYIYHHWGMEVLVFYKHLRAGSFDSPMSSTLFVKEDAELEYTEKEKQALAVFSITIIFSIIEIVLAAAIAKISGESYQKPEPVPMYYHAGQDILQLGRTEASVPETRDNSVGSRSGYQLM